MKIDDALINKLGDLAKLSFPDERREALKADLTRMLDFVEKIKELDTEGIAPLIHISEATNVWRADSVYQELSHEEALRNAPKKDSDYFRVPKVLKS
ncbi:MAG: Asp-tRNA(Asn)/Glu-tRNA(Gln) amidotransferase subunit GatC [Bacteroidetes bacterium]|jgi:aspartyl-tRNA(Asn)/glutamyl-tRNA(Gln) amidotransferase subunit C|nr:Asp-tRNA(Asn)/Glu-tRNA(Gln) amidotransferase subunit GatC [Bacteroidota bacterium]